MQTLLRRSFSRAGIVVTIVGILLTCLVLSGWSAPPAAVALLDFKDDAQIAQLRVSDQTKNAANRDSSSPARAGDAVRLGKPVSTWSYETTTRLRGFGSLNAEGALYRLGDGKASLVVLTAESPALAEVTASKYLNDVTYYGPVQSETIPGAGAAGVRLAEGGVLGVGTAGQRVFIAWTENPEALAEFLKSVGAAGWKKPDPKGHPRWLDRFDNETYGIWAGLLGGAIMSEGEIEFRKRNHIQDQLQNHDRNESFAANAFDKTFWNQQRSQNALIGSAYHARTVYGRLPAWFQIGFHRFIGGEMPGFLSYNGTFGTRIYLSQYRLPQISEIFAGPLLKTIKYLKSDPDCVSYEEPDLEWAALYNRPWLPPDCDRRFRQYLREVRSYTLDSLSEAYNGVKGALKSWEDVHFPDLAEFHDRRGNCTDLDSVPWRWRKAAKAGEGESQQWWKNDLNDSDWESDNRESARILPSDNELWYRHRFTLDPKSFAEGEVYLHILPFQGMPNGSSIRVWLNEAPVIDQTLKQGGKTPAFNGKLDQDAHLAVPVTGLLHPGENHLVIACVKGCIHGRVFLSPYNDDRGYPTADAGRNREYVDRSEYLVWEHVELLKQSLRLMRSADPDRPIMVDAGYDFRSDVFDLLEKYGGFNHYTGQHFGFFPAAVSKFTTILRGLPGTSEAGEGIGAHEAEHADWTAIRDQQGTLGTVLWAGVDHYFQYLGYPEELYSRPEIMKWIEDHRPIRDMIGKTEIEFPKIGILYDWHGGALCNSDLYWRYDVGRYCLAPLGVPWGYLEPADLVKGIGAKVPVIMDSATAYMNDQTVKAIVQYVENGGTFVAMHQTGIHDDADPNAQPLWKAFGLKRHDIDRAVFRFEDGQSLLPSGSGKKYSAQGAGYEAVGQAQIQPIARWADGSVAIGQIKRGKGRLIVLGPSLFVGSDCDAKENGVSLNPARSFGSPSEDTKTSDRKLAVDVAHFGQRKMAIFQEMLHGLGIDRDTASSDWRVWVSHRESKNGLYDVWFASWMGDLYDDYFGMPLSRPAMTFDVNETLPVKISFDKDYAGSLFALHQEGCPKVAQGRNGARTAVHNDFKPFLTYMYGAVKPEAGYVGPRHWLEYQNRTWRATEAVPATEAEQTLASYEKKYGGTDLDLTDGWKLNVSPGKDAWFSTEFRDDGWKAGSLGTWMSQGLTDPKVNTVQYRKNVSVPAEWLRPGKRIVLGWQPDLFYSYRTANNYNYVGFPVTPKNQKPEDWTGPILPLIKPKSKKLELTLYLNGQRQLQMDELPPVAADVTELVRDGKLMVAFEYTALEYAARGPAFTMYLRSIPEAAETIAPLHCETLPVPTPGYLIGNRLEFSIPENWRGKQVYLQFRQPLEKESRFSSTCLTTVFVNGDRSVSEWNACPSGLRIDGTLVYGRTNRIDFYVHRFDCGHWAGIPPEDIRLAAYDDFGQYPAP